MIKMKMFQSVFILMDSAVNLTLRKRFQIRISLQIFGKKTKSSQGTSKGTRRSYLMQETNTQKSRDTVPLRLGLL